MNVPNQLTMARFWMAALMTGCLSVDLPYARVLALAVFLLAALTDALDGFLARRYYGCTTFGKLMDPLADKVLVYAAFVGLVELGSLSAWMAVLMMSREFVVTGLRLLLTRRGIILSAGRLGKLKTVVQMVAITLYLLGLVVESSWLPGPGSARAWWLGFITTVLTAWSGAGYFWRQRGMLLERED